MNSQVYSITVFNNDTGLSLSVVSDRAAGGRRELSSVVSDIEQFYVRDTNSLDTKIPNKPRPVGNGALLYQVLAGAAQEYIGTVKVEPKGDFAKRARVDRREDFPVADRTTYAETYWINFFSKDKSKRSEHRDGFVEFMDSTGEKTRRN